MYRYRVLPPFTRVTPGVMCVSLGVFQLASVSIYSHKLKARSVGATVRAKAVGTTRYGRNRGKEGAKGVKGGPTVGAAVGVTV